MFDKSVLKTFFQRFFQTIFCIETLGPYFSEINVAHRRELHLQIHKIKINENFWVNFGDLFTANLDAKKQEERMASLSGHCQL